ncbi:MAG: erythromycin esterase family protein [Ignavibacteriaceae bacterium]
MLTPIDPDAPFVHDAWKNWVKANSQPIRSLTSANYTDLSFLTEYLTGARLVQMGEIVHGASKQNAVRVRIIKFLHEEMGFNVVAFETGFYEAYFSNKDLTNMSDIKALENSISGRWSTPELLDLIHYLKDTQATGNPLFISGFDVRPSTEMILSRPDYFRDIMLKVDSSFAEDIFIADSSIVLFYNYLFSESVRAYITANYVELVEKYNMLVEHITNNETLLLSYYTEEEYNVAKACAESARIAIDNLKGGNYYLRDMQMAETVKFLAYELFENEKIIIWAHNEHILENSDAVQHSNGNSAFGTMMGTWFKQEFGEALFSIGSFSYRGTVNASGPIVTLEVNTPNCLEVILYNTRKKYCFIDFSMESYETGNSWLFTNIQQTRFHRTGNYQIFYKPSEQFDGVLFIDTENPPTYLLLE